MTDEMPPASWGAAPSRVSRGLRPFATGLRGTLAVHAAVYLLGLVVWSAKNDLAYAIAVGWFGALCLTLVVGLALVLVPGRRGVGGGVLVGTFVGFGLELLVSAALVALWLNAHPGWELS